MWSDRFRDIGTKPPENAGVKRVIFAIEKHKQKIKSVIPQQIWTKLWKSLGFDAFFYG